jgi:predicted Zn-dependent protease
MKLTINQALQKAIQAHRLGKIKEADRLYTAILKAQPKHTDANHNLGLLAVSVGKVNESLPFLRTALEADPTVEQFWLSYIDALMKLGRKADVKAVFDQAKSKGVTGDGFNKLKKSLHHLDLESDDTTSKAQNPPLDQVQSLIDLNSQGQFQQAIEQSEALLKQFPESAFLFNFRGAVLNSLGQLDLSITAYLFCIFVFQVNKYLCWQNEFAIW